jgi:hypothetical protein
VVQASPLEKSLDVLYWWSRLMLATACGGHETHHARAACFLVVVIIRHGHNPLRAPLTPLLTTLGAPLGVSDGGGGW